MIIDAWAQNPTARFSQDRVFDSLRSSTRGAGTLAGDAALRDAQDMDEAHVSIGLISAVARILHFQQFIACVRRVDRLPRAVCQELM